MGSGWYSVEQVAERLGLHVRTVRGYIRDGRLTAVRIGKQYRVAQADLDAFTGRPAAAPPRAEVSAVVEFDGITAAAADRLSTFVVAGAQLSGAGGKPLRVQTVYDDARHRLKIIVLGGIAATADLLRTVDDITGPGNDITGAGDHITAPGNDITAADNDITGPGNDVTGPGNDSIGAGNDVLGPADGTRSDR